MTCLGIRNTDKLAGIWNTEVTFWADAWMIDVSLNTFDVIIHVNVLRHNTLPEHGMNNQVLRFCFLANFCSVVGYS